MWNLQGKKKLGRPKQEKDTGPSMMRESGSAKTGKRHWTINDERKWVGRNRKKTLDERKWVGRNRKKTLDHQ